MDNKRQIKNNTETSENTISGVIHVYEDDLENFGFLGAEKLKEDQKNHSGSEISEKEIIHRNDELIKCENIRNSFKNNKNNSNDDDTYQAKKILNLTSVSLLILIIISGISFIIKDKSFAILSNLQDLNLTYLSCSEIFLMGLFQAYLGKYIISLIIYLLNIYVI